MSHVPGSFVVNTKIPFQLLGRDSFGRVAHEPDGNEPTGKVALRAMEDRACNHRDPIPACSALPQPSGSDVAQVFRSTPRAHHSAGPAQPSQVLAALALRRERPPHLCRDSTFVVLRSTSNQICVYVKEVRVMSEADKRRMQNACVRCLVVMDVPWRAARQGRSRLARPAGLHPLHAARSFSTFFR